MIKSMTAYGKSHEEGDFGKISVELQSINRKFLDINVTLPKELSAMDPEIREFLKQHVSRGQIQLRVFFSNQEGLPCKVSLNVPLVNQYKQAVEKLADELKIQRPDSSLLQFYLQQPQIFSIEFLDENVNFKPSLMSALNKALLQFQNMKCDEGQMLGKDLKLRLEKIEGYLKEIAEIAKRVPSKYQEKLLKRVQEVNVDKELIDSRILLEVALFADKVDVSEEITRFYSHLAQFHQFLMSDEPVGKTLEFIIQEMFREANTMNVKIGDLKGVQLCLEIKGELERMREQVQNIE